MADSLERVVRKHALKNALDYGKADAKSVAGKVVAEFSDAKKDMRTTMQLIAVEVEAANSLSKTQLEKELSQYAFAERVEAKKEKWVLPGVAEGRVVTRFLPEPNGWLHLGHAKAAFLSAELARQYSGKFLLRFDDTNPEKEKQEFVDAIKQDAEWLGLRFDGESYASDLIPKFYDFAQQLVSQGDAFVCVCSQEQIKQNRMEKKECACRANNVETNSLGWKQMLDGALGEGQAVLRLKGEMQGDNTVMRDPTLFRILETPHYRQGSKYRAWPTYDFEVSISDSLEGVTHALRSKEYELRDELYYFILGKLQLRKPFVYDFSRLNIRGNALSKRLVKPFVEEKKVSGWDDPRLLSLRGMKRRGILPQAICNFVLSFGLSKVESNPSIEKLLNENKKLLEPDAEHYFFVAKPVKLLVKNSKEAFVKLPKNPHTNKGNRVLHARKEFYVSKNDVDALREGEVFRLIQLYNVKLLKKTPNSIVGEYAGKDLGEEEKRETKKLQWVPVESAVAGELVVVGDLLKGDVFNPKSLSVESGFCEEECKKLSEGAIVQFDRVGFARLDDKKKMRFVLSS
ncbi:MAG: glutamate--tRNA ligase [Candidatus Norongarragalinales archaeon]